MANSFVILPDDTTLTGKKVRTNTRTVSLIEVHEHFMILQDITSDTQARILTTDPASGDGGVVVRPIPSATATPVSGTVTVTGVSTLAEQQTQTASLSVIDDWDESDRAKVNPIVGQAGVQGASGVVTALTQRVVLATDVALPAGTNAIGKLSANSGVDIGDVDVTSVIPGTGATNLGKAEDAAHTSGDTGVLLLGVRNDSGTTVLSDTNGDYTPVATTSRGQLFLGSVVPGTTATELGKAEDGAHTSGDVGVMSLCVANEANTTFAADNDYVPHATDREGSTRTIGNRAHDAVDAGPPLKIGYQARQTNPTAVADADRVNAIGDDLGRGVVILNQVRDLVTQATTTISASTSETTILAAVASTFLDITKLILANTSQNATRIDFRDATAGTIRASAFLVPGGMAEINFPVPYPQTTVNNNWTAQSSIAVTDLRIFVQAVKNI